MPPRARKAAEPDLPNHVTIEITKDEGGYIGWLDGARPLRFTITSTVTELPAAVSSMLGALGYQGAIEVTWTGGDEAGLRAAKRLSRGTSRQSETDPD